jgi:hypothetical protein
MDGLYLAEAVAATDRMKSNIDDFLIDGERHEDHLPFCASDAGSAKCDLVNG